MGALALVAVGCGSSGTGAAGSGNVAPPAAPVAPVHSSLKRGVVFGLASNDGQKSIDIPVGTSPEIRAAQAKILSKVQTSPQVLRRELNTPSALEQRLASSDLNFSTFTTTPLKGPEPSIAYKQASSQAAHNGITFSCSPMFAAGSHTLTAKFDFPGTGPLGVFPYLQVGDLFQYSSPNNRGAFASTQSGVTFGMTTSVNGDGNGTQEITMEGGILYSGPLLRIVPWISSFQSGLHHATVTIDGETVVDEDFIQRGLLFKDRLPQISAGQPDNIAVQTSFGWTDDGAAIDDTISVDSPRWRAALGNTKNQAEGSLSSSAWHDGNAVSFTINNLRETLTKNLQPLTQVPIDPRAKTYESNKTLNYAVQAQALASFRYFGMTDFGQVPGFRRDVILSNFQQNPPRATLGTPVVFEFDINAINFESGNPQVDFGLAEDPQTGVFEFFSHGELSETDTGWHVRVPWTAAPLSSPSGRLFVSVTESSDSGKAAYVTQDFQVSLDEQNKKLRIENADPNPKTFDPSKGESSGLEYDVRWSGLGTPPQIHTQVKILNPDGTVFFTFENQIRNEASFHISLPPWNGRDAQGNLIDGPFKWAISAFTVPEVAGEVGEAERVDETKDGVAQNQASSELTIVDFQRQPLAKAFGNPTPEQRAERNQLWRTIHSDSGSKDWFVRAQNLKFTSSPAPDKITAVASSSFSNVTVNVTLDKQGDGSYDIASLGDFFPAGRSKEFVIPAERAPNDRKPSYTTIDGIVSGADNEIGQDIAQQVLIPGNKIFPAVVTEALGLFREALSVASDSKDNLSLDSNAPTINPGDTPKRNFSTAGYEILKFKITDPRVVAESQLQATVKLAHSADIVSVNLHGGHTADVFLGGGISFGPRDGVSPTPTTWIFLACNALDFRDFNGFFTSSHFPSNLPSEGYDPSSGVVYSDTIGNSTIQHRREFGGPEWLRNVGWGNPNATAKTLKNTVLLGYNAPAPATFLKSVNTEFQNQLNKATPAGHDPRIFAWLRANRIVAKRSPGSIAWTCLSACAWDKSTGHYYYIPYGPPNGSYMPDGQNTRLPHASVAPDGDINQDPTLLSEFGIWCVEGSNTQAPQPDANYGWAIPPKTIGVRLEK